MKGEDLFASASKDEARKLAPLAYRMRPQNWDEFAGQQHIVGEGKLLRRLVDSDRIFSFLFFGPPGTGKTSLAELIAAHTASHFSTLNAVESKISDVRRVIEEARNRFDYHRMRTILFIDEIHRFNRSQQDVLLKDLEKGTLSFIGATTANPLYSLNTALVSRCKLFDFRPLAITDMTAVVQRVLKSEKGLLSYNVSMENEVIKRLVKRTEGDLRSVLNFLELAVVSTPADGQGRVHLTAEIIDEVTENKAIVFDENEKYDLISALIKSMRDSKEDDAMHYLARLLVAGEDPLYIARRMIIFASEDIGLADPEALSLANAVYRACEVIGMPEVQINLGHAAVYLSRAPKNRDSYKKIKVAMKRVRELPNNPVPEHLRNWKI